jgi:hypothetical protein
VFVNLGIGLEICFGFCLAICPIGKNIKKIMVSRNLRQAHLLEVGLTQFSVDHAPWSIVRHVGLHVDFSSTNVFWAIRPSPPSVKWTWTVSAFSTNESSYIAMVKGLQPCVWSGPYNLVPFESEGHYSRGCLNQQFKLLHICMVVWLT